MKEQSLSELKSLNHSYFYSGQIQEALETSLAMTVRDTKDYLQLACASDTKKQLYVFNLKYVEQSIAVSNGLNGFNHSDYRMPEFINRDTKQTGQIVFSAEKKDQHIVSVASFPELKEEPVAIALNTGEILLGAIRENKFVTEKKLEGPSSAGEF